jgi:hypothetical protein
MRDKMATGVNDVLADVLKLLVEYRLILVTHNQQHIWNQMVGQGFHRIYNDVLKLEASSYKKWWPLNNQLYYMCSNDSSEDI